MRWTALAAADALSMRAGVVVEHSMDPGVVGRVEALKASIPKGTLDRLLENAGALTPRQRWRWLRSEVY